MGLFPEADGVYRSADPAQGIACSWRAVGGDRGCGGLRVLRADQESDLSQSARFLYWAVPVDLSHLRCGVDQSVVLRDFSRGPGREAAMNGAPRVPDYCGAGVRPWRRMTSTMAAGLGGVPDSTLDLMTAAISRK